MRKLALSDEILLSVQLINAGASKKDASTYAFGFLTDYENEAQYLIDTVQKIGRAHV